MRVVVAYDISSDRRRNQVAQILEGTLTRVQYSVFEGDVPEQQLGHAVKKATAVIENETDSIRVYPLCATCATKIESHGRTIATVTEDIRIL